MVYLAVACGWPLFLFYYGEYSKLKLECETYANLSAKTQARLDFQSGRRVLYILPNQSVDGLTNIHEGTSVLTYSNYSLFSDLFVRQYNQRMAQLMNATNK